MATIIAEKLWNVDLLVSIVYRQIEIIQLALIYFFFLDDKLILYW